jgi:hypothetical protein
VCFYGIGSFKSDFNADDFFDFMSEICKRGPFVLFILSLFLYELVCGVVLI